MEYKVVEKFVSINGEGQCAGELAAFVRFQGCNLNCSYCDTSWANEKDAPYQVMTEEEICSWIQQQNVTNVTLTGGEPLLQPGMDVLLKCLSRENLRIEIETNGSVGLAGFVGIGENIRFTMDYKLNVSGMTEHMCVDNFALLSKKDTVKFVSGSLDDLEQAREIIEKYHLTEVCKVYISPVFGQIDPADIVDYMIEHHQNGMRLQLQLHKFIWDPQRRGV